MQSSPTPSPETPRHTAAIADLIAQAQATIEAARPVHSPATRDDPAEVHYALDASDLRALTREIDPARAAIASLSHTLRCAVHHLRLGQIEESEAVLRGLLAGMED